MKQLVSLIPSVVAKVHYEGSTKYFPHSLCQILLLWSLSFLAAFPNPLHAQNDFCHFDEVLQQQLNDDPAFDYLIEDLELVIQNGMIENPQAIMNNVVYTIPVVFHVIHLGEPVGVGSNISDAQLLQALEDLNDDFRDIQQSGYDVEIQFCLAQRTPAGNSSTGIIRVNGNGIGNYQNVGIAQGGNEAQVKGLSIWPNSAYLNIWVVHKIDNSNNTQGFASLPGSPASTDGIVMRADATGTSGNSGVIGHEAGHFFFLFHTFQGGDETNCPPNTNCQTDGDLICDTSPHLLVYGGCDDTSNNPCNGNTPIGDVAYNHMNYTGNACRDRFTPDQVMRMRSALLNLRYPLTYSLGCEPGCSTTTADFTMDPPLPIVESGVPVDFVNASVNADSFCWLINGEIESTDEDLLNYVFLEPGRYEVCLDAKGPNCINRKCTQIIVLLDCFLPNDPCEKVINGDFDQIIGVIGADTELEDVCGWRATCGTPFYCNSLNAQNAMGLFLNYLSFEKFSSGVPLDITQGQECTLSFDYLVANNSADRIIVALSENDPTSCPALDPGSQIIADILNPTVDYSGQQNHTCYDFNQNFTQYTSTFMYNGINPPFISVTGSWASTTGRSYIFIDNLSLRCCDDNPVLCLPEPDFNFLLDSCFATFTGSNSGDDGTYIWNFGDGITGTGQYVSHDFIFGGTFDVCLTITCDVEQSSTVCKQIIIPESCNRCDTLEQITAVLCEESEDSTDTYLANFSFQVPKGFKACGEDDLFVWSDQVSTPLASYEIDNSATGFDVVTVSIYVIATSNFSLLDSCATGYITLCSDSSVVICRQFTVCGRACDVCATEVSTTANCVSFVQNTGIYTYQGSVTVTVPEGATPCDITAEEVGFSANVTPAGPTTWTVNYTVVTTNANLTNTSALLCFVVTDEVFCYPLELTLLPCTPFPDDCVAEWMPKEMVCSGVENDSVIFNIQKCVYGGAYEVCEGFGLFGTVDGNVGWVEVNSGGVVFTQFCFDIDIKIPVSEFISGQLYYLKLYLCDANGEMVCYYFPFKLICEDTDAGGGERSSAGAETPNPSVGMYSIQPNPARYQFTVVSRDFDPAVQRTLRILDHTGRAIKASNISLPKEEVSLVDYPAGVYFVSILEEGVPVYFEKLVIVR